MVEFLSVCIDPDQSEFFDAQARGYIYQPAKDWDFWVWNSDYDEDLGLGHVGLDAFNQ